ncbi:hypothetical protein PVK06_041852 [Gossypium arboreum]|uniref:AAA+ ATPase domain-containing protein n=1 Tax=Gossypium arboreum TaxID=29729 RepID=A0ABR0NC79_GOSAR|nr:hypothetical protein PVK06_041852 [Gossypium arboreum]
MLKDQTSRKFGMHRTTWSTLKKLRMSGCGRIKIFGHEESQIQHSLFLIEKVGYRGLKRLKLSEFPELVDIWSRNPQEMLDFTTLEFLEVCDSNNLRYIFNLSIAFGLGQLRQMEIKRCGNLEQVIKEEGPITMVKEAITDGSKIISIFPRLQSIIVESCQDMTCFYMGSKVLECPSLVEIKIVDCSNMTTFVCTFSRDEDKEVIIGDEVDNVAAIFSNKVAFPNLEKITISHLRNAKKIWHSKLHKNSFFMLKELTVKECDVLEKLIVIDCASLEEVFQLQVQGLDIQQTYVVDNQLRELNLVCLPRLKHVWTKYHKGNISFESLQQVCIRECWSLKTLFPFSIAKGLQQLETLIIERCGLGEIVSKNVEGSDEQKIWFEFDQLSFLMLCYLPYLTCFYLGMHRTTCSTLKQLRMAGCGRIKIFGHEESQIQHSLFLFEKTLKDKRDRLLLDVDAAEKNGEDIYPEVNSWLAKADKMTDSELKEVKGLEDEAKSKCFIGLCPNFKARYQLSKKAEEDAAAVDELLQQGGFDKVSYRDVPQPILFVPPKDFEDFDSRRLMFNKITEAVKDPNVNIIGVHGMPGVGKTTLVKEVVRQVKEDKLFDSVVMAVVTHTPDVQKIQDQIADMLGLKFEEQSMTGRASRLCQRLKKEKKILVVLDDIWAKLDLMEVGIPLGDEDQGCTILLTSRDLNVFFPIGVLEHEEAWHFFKNIIGDGVESSDLLPIATEVAKKCGGLPIAIRTLSTFLRNELPFVWEDALRQLSKPSSSNFQGVPATVYSTIKWSYDRLQSEDHRQIFLLCSLMGHNASLDLLLVLAMGLGLFHGVSTIKETRNKLLTVVSHLKASCLLLDGNTNMHFDMHDLISDVAMSIASKGNPVFVLSSKHDLNDWPDDETMKECDKISCFGMSELPDQLKCPKLTLMGMGSKDPWMKIPTNFFKATKNLKVLYLAGMNLPSSISLLGNLRALVLINCVLGDITLIGELKNLEILNIVSSDIEMLHNEIGQLTKLKRLDLRGCSKLKRIPPGVLCKLSRLEELYMDKDFDEWGADGHSSQESNSSLAELKALSCLTALEIHISNAKIIPKDFSFEKLQRYMIFIGEATHWDWNWSWVREYSRTLKLNLRTNISFLNNGVKVLLKKAENLYIDEVKGVEILLHELEVGNYFQQLKNLHIQNGAMVQYILKGSDAVQKIEFLQLESLTLQGLPNLISFCSKKEGSTSISPQEISLFKQKILFPKLEKLKLFSIGIERIWSSQAFCSTQNLTSLIIQGCANLKYVLSDSMLEYLQQLKCLEISECKCIQEIMSTDKMIQETLKNRAIICFPRLNILKLKGLHKLIRFCHEDYTIEFPVLTILEIENCSELKEFIHNSMRKDIPTHEVLFNNKVAFPNLEKITISHLRNAKRIWFDQLHTNSFSMLKELTVKECDALLNIFSPFLLGLFQRLEKLIVIDCASLEQVFQLQVQDLDIEETYVVDNQLKEVNLVRLPNVEESDEQEICFAFNKLSYLEFWNLPYLTYFYPRMHKTTWTALKQLMIFRCGRIKIFGHEESQIQHPLFLIEKVIPQLENVSFSRGDIEMISDGQYESDLFFNIKFLRISCYSNVSDVFPISFLKRFYNLESLELGSCNFKELDSFESDACEDKDMIITIPKIKKLKLVAIKNIRHLWKQNSLLDHICASLKCLEVWECDNLICLGLDLSFFETLTTLDVWKCNKMLDLITSFNARSLVCLVTMRIRESKMMREVVASDGDEASYETVFRGLKRLELHCLQNLTSFCSGNHTLWCPSLEQFTLSQCPRMKNFCQGELITPKLDKVQLTETDFRGRWAGDLNATVEQLYKEQVGYRGLKHLKFSEFPKLIDIWSKNPQEMLDFTVLEFLEICNSNNLRYIFYLSTAFSLGQLRQMEIKRCGNLKQVIKEECSITMVEEAITDSSKIISIFPRLQSIIVESCPNMTSFYQGSKCLEFPSLDKIKVVGCSNMTTFVSTFSRDEDKEAIIGDEVDNVTTFFSNKVRLILLNESSFIHLHKLVLYIHVSYDLSRLMSYEVYF